MFNMRIAPSRRRTDSICKNIGFGPVIIVREGEKRLTPEEMANMTVSHAMKLLKKGLAVTSA